MGDSGSTYESRSIRPNLKELKLHFGQGNRINSIHGWRMPQKSKTAAILADGSG
jgi:hypothetical protein